MKSIAAITSAMLLLTSVGDVSIDSGTGGSFDLSGFEGLPLLGREASAVPSLMCATLRSEICLISFLREPSLL